MIDMWAIRRLNKYDTDSLIRVLEVNEDQAKKDALDRAAIITALEERLKQGDKWLFASEHTACC